MDEDRLARIAHVNASSARALIQLAGMQAENAARIQAGEALAYTEDKFLALIDENQLGWNSVQLAVNP